MIAWLRAPEQRRLVLILAAGVGGMLELIISAVARHVVGAL